MHLRVANFSTCVPILSYLPIRNASGSAIPTNGLGPNVEKTGPNPKRFLSDPLFRRPATINSVTDRELLRHIERSPNRRAGYKQLVREFSLGGGRERRLLLEHLARLTAAGHLVKTDREQWAIPKPPAQSDHRPDRRSDSRPDRSAGYRPENLVAGRLDLHRDGFGFVRPAQGDREDDIFIPPNEIGDAMQGDQVLVELAPPRSDGRKLGRIVRVLTRRNATVVGTFHYAREGRGRDNSPGNYVTPFDDRMTQPIIIPFDAQLPSAERHTPTPHRVLGEEAIARIRHYDRNNLEGLVVDVEITAWPTPTRPARGTHHRRSSATKTTSASTSRWSSASTISRASFPTTSSTKPAPSLISTPKSSPPAATSATCPSSPSTEKPPATSTTPCWSNTDRRSHRPLASPGPHRRRRPLRPPGTALDLEARLRGNSVYFPDRAIPMLPQELSTNICSLRPNEDRLVLSCLMDIDASGNILDYEVTEGVIRSARRMTYTQVHQILEGDPSPRAPSSPRSSPPSSA